MQFEYDPEKLIEEVRKRPGIWDIEDIDYRARNVRNQLWKEVVNELKQPDVKITKSELRELELQLQKKWKSIRDSFQKYVQNPNRTKRPYIYVKQLQFLFKNTPPPTDGGVSSESETGMRLKKIKKPYNVWRYKKKFKLSNDDDQSSDDDNNENGDSDNNEESRDYSNHETHFVNADVPVKVRKIDNTTDEFVFANVDAQPKSDDDPDKMFLLSLLPHLKAVPEEARLNVKMDLMQVLRNASYRDQKIF